LLPFNTPLSAGNLFHILYHPGTIEFLNAAVGEIVGNPGVTVVDIDGDGSFMMNMGDHATITGSDHVSIALVVFSFFFLSAFIETMIHVKYT
jgi:hypothetical protein